MPEFHDTPEFEEPPVEEQQYHDWQDTITSIANTIGDAGGDLWRFDDGDIRSGRAMVTALEEALLDLERLVKEMDKTVTAAEEQEQDDAA